MTWMRLLQQRWKVQKRTWQNNMEEPKLWKKYCLSLLQAYNVASTLKETIDPFIESGVLDQLDIMIVDDGSKDDTAKIAQEYADNYPSSIRLISKENGGWGSTVNTGIRLAAG